MKFDVQEQAARVHSLNAKWWINLETGEPLKRNFGELIMLTISELAEALEGDRKNLMDDKLPHRSMLEVELADTLIRMLDYIGGLKLPVKTVERDEWLADASTNTAERLLRITVELCMAYENWVERDSEMRDCCVTYLEQAMMRIFMLAEDMRLDLLGAYEEKLAFNAVRADHQVEARRAEGGKKY